MLLSHLEELGKPGSSLYIKETKMAEETKDKLVSLEDLGAYADTVNDATTGINLLRGTRDFRKYSEVLAISDSANVSIDGWNILGGPTIELDDDGFKYLRHTTKNQGTSAITRLAYSQPIRAQRNKKYTLSFEFYAETIPDNATNQYYGTIGAYNDTTFVQENFKDITSTVINNPFQLTEEETGKWYKVVYIYTPNFTEDEKWIRFMPTIRGNQTVRFKKIKLEENKIYNPIWSPSPFDIDYVNDYTTGTNLLRGTKDFRFGIMQGLTYNNVYKTDGFVLSNVGIDNYYTYKDDDGFSVFRLSFSGLSSDNNKTLYAPIIKCSYKDTFTISFEFKIEEECDSLQILRVMEYGDSGNLVYGNKTFSQCGVSSPEIGKWYKAKYVYTVQSQEATNVAFGLLIYRNGTVSFRKMKAEIGSINNPIWSPSPFDIDYINDETTGINLFRGTRDFVKGSTTVPTSSGYYLDGCAVADISDLSKDTSGFTVATINGPKSGDKYIYSSAVPIESNKIYTVSFEAKASDPSILSSVGIIRLTKLNNTGAVTEVTVNKTVDGIIVNQMEPDTWYKFVFTISGTFEGTAYLVALPRLTANKATNLSARKMCAYEGNINNPIWSASPFDVAQDVPMVNLGALDDSKKIKENDDLNDYKQVGEYCCHTDSRVKTLSHCPSSNAFKLYVEKPTGTNDAYLKQWIQNYDENCRNWFRLSKDNGNTWLDWHQTYANTTVRPIEAGGTGRTDGLSTGIAGKIFNTGDDLDTFLTSGRWYSNAVAISQSLLNKPEGVAVSHLTLDVTPYTSPNIGTSAFQELTLTGSDTSIRKFIRLIKSTGVKTEWAEVLTTLNQSSSIEQLLEYYPSPTSVTSGNSITTTKDLSSYSGVQISGLIITSDSLSVPLNLYLSLSNVGTVVDVSYALDSEASVIASLTNTSKGKVLKITNNNPKAVHINSIIGYKF